MRFHLFATLLTSILAAGFSHACNTPVFRYALEKWEPDFYAVTLLHRGPLTEAQKALVKKLEAAASDEKRPANLYMTALDLAEKPDTYKALLDHAPEDVQAMAKQLEAGKTHLFVHYPLRIQNPPTIWCGPLEDLPAEALLDSPARREIARRLLKGDSAVWLYLDSDPKSHKPQEGHSALQASSDEALLKVIEPAMRQFEKEFELPVPEQLEGENPLKLKFSILRLKRDDPQERFLQAMLLDMHPPMKEDGVAVLAPVFGRGRVLEGVAGPEIAKEVIHDIGFFLCGPCSCEVKDQNPGYDLLLACDWEGLIFNPVVVDKELPELTGLPDLPAPSKPKAHAPEHALAKPAHPHKHAPAHPVQAEGHEVVQYLPNYQPPPHAGPGTSLLAGVLAVALLLAAGVVTSAIVLRSREH